MRNAAKKLISQSFYRLLSGIVRLALRNGVTYKEFSTITKLLYVRISAAEYGLQGRPTNMARIALLTGLDRKEIKRVISQTTAIEAIEAAPDRMSKILTAWHQEKEYIDTNGQPLDIAIDGPAPSFTHLVKSYGGDIAVITVLREFKRSQTIVEVAEEKVKVQKRYFVPNYLGNSEEIPELANPEAINQGSSMLIDHINTIFHNLYREDINERGKIDLRATNISIRKDAVDDFYKLVDQKGMEFLTDIDTWLSQHQTNDSSQESERLGIGLYFIEGENESFVAVTETEAKQ